MTSLQIFLHKQIFKMTFLSICTSGWVGNPKREPVKTNGADSFTDRTPFLSFGFKHLLPPLYSHYKGQSALAGTCS